MKSAGVRPLSDTGVLVTGVTGFLGWHIAAAMRDAGWRVTGAHRPGRESAAPEGIARVDAGLDADALTRAAEGASVVVHAAGLTSARRDADFDAVNVAGTRAVVAAANAAGARLILVSSQAAIGAGTRERPSLEDDPPRPLNAYGRSKLAAEAVVMADARRPWVILRPSSVYGPRDRQFLTLFRMAARGVFPLPADPAMPLTLVHVDDVVRAVLLAAAQSTLPASPVFFVGHPEPQSTASVLQTLAEIFGQRYRPWRVPAPVVGALSGLGDFALRAGMAPPLHRARLAELRAAGFVCSTDRAREALGFTAAVGLREGCAQTARWYREHGLV